MTKALRILIAVDESDATRRALAYVGEMVGSRSDTTVRLLHLLPSTPPQYLEHGGAESPNEEERLDEDLRATRDAWLAKKREEAQTLFEDAVRLLESHGLVAARIETECRPSFGPQSVAKECLEAAADAECGTIVLARQSMPWHKELLHHHQSTELIRRGRGFTVWVVE